MVEVSYSVVIVDFLVLLAAIIGVLVLLARYYDGRKKREATHGFEVNLNAGKRPAEQKKENDHG